MCQSELTEFFAEFTELWGENSVSSLFWNSTLETVPSQQEKIHAHSFVLGPELVIQYIYTYVKNSEHHRFRIRYTYLAFLAGICLVPGTNTHAWKVFLVNEFEFNTNTYTSKFHREFELYYFRADGIPPVSLFEGSTEGYICDVAVQVLSAKTGLLTALVLTNPTVGERAFRGSDYWGLTRVSDPEMCGGKWPESVGISNRLQTPTVLRVDRQGALSATPWALLNRGKRKGGYATWVWQERVRKRATQNDIHAFNHWFRPLFFVASKNSTLITSLMRHLLVTEKKRTPNWVPPLQNKSAWAPGVRALWGLQKKKTFCGPKWPVWEPRFDPKILPSKNYVGRFFAFLPRKWRLCAFFVPSTRKSCLRELVAIEPLQRIHNALRTPYIYIYAVESKLGPKIAFFWVKTWSNFSLFFFVFQKSSSFCRENEIFKKNEPK